MEGVGKVDRVPKTGTVSFQVAEAASTSSKMGSEVTGMEQTEDEGKEKQSESRWSQHVDLRGKEKIKMRKTSLVV